MSEIFTGRRALYGLVLVLFFTLFAPAHFRISTAYATEPSNLIVSIIDVGQGDSILVEFPDGETMLVDAGPSDASRAVIDFIDSRDFDKIDILVATHPHEDHIGGMVAVMNRYDIGKVWDSGYDHGSRTQENFLQAIFDRQIQYGTPRAGFTQSVGDVLIEILAPPEQLLGGTGSDANNNNIVMRLSYGDISFLLTGDMEADERATVSDWPECTILKIAHHGSRNGTDLAFLRDVSPEVAVISYGAGNSFGHPHQETRGALSAFGCAVKSTAANGTVTITTDGNSYGISTTRPYMPSVLAPSSSASTGSDASGNYIGNINSHVFHRPSCSHLPRHNNRVYFDTRDEAIAAGYRPCGICNP